MSLTRPLPPLQVLGCGLESRCLCYAGVPFPKPPNYEPHRYELLSRLLAANTKKLGRSPMLREVSLIARIPNGKADFNNKRFFATLWVFR